MLQWLHEHTLPGREQQLLNVTCDVMWKIFVLLTVVLQQSSLWLILGSCPVDVIIHLRGLGNTVHKTPRLQSVGKMFELP
jgi:hypothetical protein